MIDTILVIQKIGILEISLIVLIILLLFGAKKIPYVLKELGKGISEFSKETENKTTEKSQ